MRALYENHGNYGISGNSGETDFDNEAVSTKTGSEQIAKQEEARLAKSNSGNDMLSSVATSAPGKATEEVTLVAPDSATTTVPPSGVATTLLSEEETQRRSEQVSRHERYLDTEHLG